jgi:UDP-glucose 4-epimerase
LKILFTGASSFTGYWFVSKLCDAGHEVCCTFTRASAEHYKEDMRGRRVQCIVRRVRPTWNCTFGDQRFLSLIGEFRPDLLCHHAAEARDYKSPEFDHLAAVSRNAHRLPEVLNVLNEAGCNRIVLTGTVFEGGEGAGSDGLPDLSRYGLSKSLTFATFRYFCRGQFSLGKFVIPNPFGPLEEPRFTSHLVRCWRAGEAAAVRTPDYIRDNIHVDLLALAYRKFALELPSSCGFIKINPSGYTESQGEFAQRVAREFRSRTGWECALAIARQTDRSEPLVRTNTEAVDGAALGWSEPDAWKKMVDFYSAA